MSLDDLLKSFKDKKELGDVVAYTLIYRTIAE